MKKSVDATLIIPPERLKALPATAAPLLFWYDRHARPLPWRKDPTPYHIWISEIMLQQTRVEAVKEYYRRFLAELPTIGHLAAVEEERLLKLWEGLGYYNRARNLRKAARQVMERYGGRLPDSYDQLLTLPGIGEYTAGAIASIAFHIPVPAVDGNVYRVLSRLLASYGNIDHTDVKKAFRQAAALWISRERPGDFNQAVMDLGATVCLPNGTPQCLLCPLSGSCTAFSEGCAEELPVREKKKQRKEEQRTILVIAADGKLLLFQRKKGVLKGLYEPLNLDGALPPVEIEATLRAIGCQPSSIESLGPAKHLFTHIEWHMDGYLIHCAPFDTEGGVWADPDTNDFPIPSAFQSYMSKANIR